MIYSCENEEEYLNLCCFVKKASTFLNLFKSLTDSYILEFFIENQWSLLPSVWRTILEKFSIENLIDFMNNKKLKNFNQVLPLSLLCFQNCCKIYKFNSEFDIEKFSENFKLENQEISSKNYFDKQKINLLNKHLKPKKRHEIENFSKLISKMIKDEKCKIFDFGSGQGHLSRYLAFKYNLNLTCIDINENFIANAEKFNKQFIDESKFYESNGFLKPKQINMFINEKNYYELTKDETNYALLGLHACGNLSHDLLVLFKNYEAKFLFLCSCCYHKTKEDRYLISSYLKEINLNLSLETRANACHSIDNFIKQLINDTKELKVHFYRALLEYIFENYSSKNRKKTLSKVHDIKSKTFYDYVKCATKNLDFKFNLESYPNINEKFKEEKLVLIFYSLRLLLGPVTESILLADRMLYLYEEKKLKSKLIPIFDVSLSPRNFLLYSIK